MNANAAAALYLLREVDGAMTTTDVAEVVFSPEDTEDLRNAERKVRYYFEDSYSHLFDTREADDGTVKYDIEDGAVWVGNGAMTVMTPEEELVEIDFGDVLVYLDESGVPQTVQLSDGEGVPGIERPTSEETGF